MATEIKDGAGVSGSITAFFNLVSSPVKFRLFLFKKLPSAFFTGLRVKAVDEKTCTVTVPYKWFSQNPFRSTYFACLSMAAEMSTGILAMAQTYRSNPPVSMLVIKTEGEYFKKATGITSFTCEDGDQIKKAVSDALSSGESHWVRARSIGVNIAGEKVAEFFITWSFKRKG